MNLGVALGGGGARALASIGVLKVLQNNGFEISEVSGSSMGSIIGAYYCKHREVASLENLILSMKKTDYLKLIDFNNLKKSFIKGGKIEHFLKTNIGAKKFSELKIPLIVVSTDLLTGQEVLFEKGDLIKSVMSSIAVPGLFPPVNYKRRLLVDGGVSNPTPVDVLKTDKRLGVDFSVNIKRSGSIDTFDVISLSFSVIRAKQLMEKLKNDDNTHILKPKTGLELNGLLRFDKAEKFIRAGEVAAKKNIKHIKELIK